MDLNTVIQNIRNAVHDDPATQAWCTSNYGRNQKVYVGVDARKPPSDDDYPIAHVYPLTKREALEDQGITVGVSCGLVDDDTRTVAGKTNIVEMEGIQNLEAFRRKVCDAALSASLDNGYQFVSITTEYETIEFFPHLICDMELHIMGEFGFNANPFD